VSLANQRNFNSVLQSYANDINKAEANIFKTIFWNIWANSKSYSILALANLCADIESVR
jgi:hypothetical protein